jgi:hypothetical protein
LKAASNRGDSPSFASNPYLDSVVCVISSSGNTNKLVGTSPGTFDYAIAIKNIGEDWVNTINIDIAGPKEGSVSKAQTQCAYSTPTALTSPLNSLFH